jgi:hypothetical protein
MFYQTDHRKYLLEGTVARLPPGARALVSRTFTTFADQPWLKYVVIHRDVLDVAFPVARTQLEQVERILATENAVRVAADGPLEIWRLSTFQPGAVVRTFPDIPDEPAIRVSSSDHEGASATSGR